MQLNFEQVILQQKTEDLITSLIEMSSHPNLTILQIQMVNHIIIKLQKLQYQFSTSEIEYIIINLTLLHHNLILRQEQQVTTLIKNIKECRNQFLLSIDPNHNLIKKLISPLSIDYQEGKLRADKVQLVMEILTKIFQNQNPICQGNRSYIYMRGQSNITLVDPLKWNYDKNPLEDGLTLSFWFTAQQLISDVKIFSFLNKQKVGFQLLLRQQKLYYQRLQQEKKFSLIKSKGNLVYLCDISLNCSSFLTVQFQIKKKIFARNYCVVNVFYNNMTFNNIQVDIPAGNFKLDNIQIDILTNFRGKVYSLLAASKNLYSLIQELNIPRGFNTENDIRNLTFNFQNQVSKIIYFYTPIRAMEHETGIKVYDVFHKNSGIISNALLKINLSIKKDLSYYGGLGNILSFLLAIQNVKVKGQSNLFNTFLILLKTIFMNKPGTQQQIISLNMFGCIREYLLRTKMQLFDQRTIYLFKEIYVALGTKYIRQQYLKQIIWSLKPSLHLQFKLFMTYCNLIQSFYNEDIQASLSVFGIKEIIGYIVDNLQPRGECCNEHSLNKVNSNEYCETIEQYFKIIQNILIFKRSDSDLNELIGEIIQIFTLKTSVCFNKVFLLFLERICENDQKIQHYFIAQIKSNQIKSILYMFLANVPCFKIKTLILKFIFRYYHDDKFLNEKSTAFELSICMRNSDFQNWKNSTLSHDDKRSHDSSEFGSQHKSTSLTEVVKYLDKNREFPVPEFVNEPELIDTILEWSFKKPRPDDIPNNGLLLLSDVYKYSTTSQKKYIWNKLSSVLQKSRFDVQVLIWLTQSLLQQLIKKQSGDKQIQSQILSIISQYHIYTIVSEEQQQIALIINTMIRSIFSFRFSRQSSQSVVAAYLKIFNSFIKGCNKFDIDKLESLGSIIIKSCYKHLIGYFVSANFDTEECFEEPEDESIVLNILLEIMENIYTLLHSLVRGENKQKDEEKQKERKRERQKQRQANDSPTTKSKYKNKQRKQRLFHIISQQNPIRNKKILQILFPQASFIFSNSNKVSFMCMIFVTLQSVFQHLQQLEIENHKKCLNLIEKFLVLQMELTENCGGIENFSHCLEEIRFIYLNVLSFLEIKYYQYQHYSMPTGAQNNEHLNSKIRNNILEISQSILDVFFTIIQLLKCIDDMGSKEHKSFYQLMKPKKSLKPKLSLKHNEWLKKIDEKWIEFYYINDLRNDARSKLDNFLRQRKISRSSSEIQKMIALNMQKFTAQQKTDFFKIQKKSLKSYQDSQREYYKVSRAFQQKLNNLLSQYRSKQSLQESKRLHNQQKNRRIAKKAQYDIWQQSRLYEGFWSSPGFYGFSQNEQMKYNLELSNYYCRRRLLKQTSIGTLPFINIYINNYPIKQSEDIFLQFDEQHDDSNSKTKSTKKSQKYFKMGLQFLKKKVINKIIRSSSDKMMSQQTFFSDVMINNDMALQPGDLKINRERIQFSYKPVSPDLYHLTLIKFKIKELQLLSVCWKLCDISSVKFRKFLLKANSIELFFKDGESVLLIFSGEQGVSKCNQFSQVLYRLRKSLQSHDDLPPEIFWKPLEPIKLIQKVDLTKRWINNEISNFQYILGLNFISGRSNNDLNQYPVLPWIFNGYSNFVDQKDNYRDFSKNMGCLGSEQRKQKFKKVYQNVQNFKSINHQYHFGFHYSNLPIVMQFLVRIQPYTDASKQLQGGKFDVADRLFSSISQSYDKSINQMSDIRQLIPQFFYMPEFLINMESLNLGIQQNGKKVDNVEISLGLKTPYEFIEFHRQHLESSYVSQNIQKWIDLVFGYKNTGKQAQISLNKFYYLTYEQNLEMSLQDQNRTSAQSQMAFFGKTPSQLFLKPHPQKIPVKQKPITFSKLSRMRIIKQQQDKSKSKSKELYPSCQLQQIIHLSYCRNTKRYIVLRKDFKGMIFILAENQSSFYSEIVKEFSLNLNSYEQIWIRHDDCSSIPIVSINGSGIIVGGYWGGRLISCDILDDKIELNWKHIDTITSITKSELNKIIISCSQSGEVVTWQYNSKMRLQFKNKLILHNGNVNSIVINDHLKVYVTGGEDGLINIIDLFSYKRIRTIKLQESIRSVDIVVYPYYIIFVCTQNKQKCYSINGQLISKEKLNITSTPVVFKQIGFKDRVLLRVGQEILFIKLPSFEIMYRHELKKGDEKANNFIINESCMLYTVPNTVVCAQRTHTF